MRIWICWGQKSDLVLQSTVNFQFVGATTSKLLTTRYELQDAGAGEIEFQEMIKMKYEIRLALEDDIPPVLDLAWRMFVKYDSPDYGVEQTERMREAMTRLC